LSTKKPTARERRIARQAREREVTKVRLRRAARDLSNSMKETDAQKRERRLTQLTRLAAAAADHHLYLRAAALPEKADRTPGRPAMFPNFVMLLFGQAISVFGSAASTAVWFADHKVWDIVRDTIRDNIDPDMAAALPDTGPMLHQWNHFQRKMSKNDWLPLLHAAQRDTAAQRALDMGMFDPNERFHITDPVRDLTVTFDGKVSTSPSRYPAGVPCKVDKATGEVLTNRRHDSNTKLWPEAGTPDIPAGADAKTIARLKGQDKARFEWGIKGTYAWARLPYYGTRLVLDVETMSPEDADEAAAIARITDGLLNRLPGIQTIVMDGIYRHTHIDPYMKKGLLVVNKPQQGRKGAENSVKVGDRWEKSHHIETVEVPFGAGVCRHRIYGIGGAPYEQTVNAAGEAEFVALPGRTLRRKRKTYTDWYRVVDITCTRCGGKQEHRIPLTSHHRCVATERLQLLVVRQSFDHESRSARPSSHTQPCRGRASPPCSIQAMGRPLHARAPDRNGRDRRVRCPRPSRPRRCRRRLTLGALVQLNHALEQHLRTGRCECAENPHRRGAQVREAVRSSSRHPHGATGGSVMLDPVDLEQHRPGQDVEEPSTAMVPVLCRAVLRDELVLGHSELAVGVATGEQPSQALPRELSLSTLAGTDDARQAGHRPIRASMRRGCLVSATHRS